MLYKSNLSQLYLEYIIDKSFIIFSKISISPKRYRHYTTKLEKCQYIFKKIHSVIEDYLFEIILNEIDRIGCN